MSVDRRTALKVLAGGGAAALSSALPASAREKKTAPPGAIGMLYDTTRCIGCKTCVVACKEANDRAVDPGPWDEKLYDAPVDLNGDTKNIIKLLSDGTYSSYMKSQCMHCIDPACAAACMLGSLHKDEVTGVVGYNPAYCVGCRFCMMSCPFNVPKFEFDSATPNIVKCELCRHRVEGEATQTASGFTRYPKGQGPACCEVCPREAVIYGKRDELLAEAGRRIAETPGKYYQDRVYGETDGGGTQVLYLSHVPFAKLGLPELGERGTPHVAYSVQEGIYYKLPFVAPAALYAALVAVQIRNRKSDDTSGGGER